MYTVVNPDVYKSLDEDKQAMKGFFLEDFSHYFFFCSFRYLEATEIDKIKL